MTQGKHKNFQEQNIKVIIYQVFGDVIAFLFKHFLVPFEKAGLCRLCRIIRERGSGNLR